MTRAILVAALLLADLAPVKKTEVKTEKPRPVAMLVRGCAPSDGPAIRLTVARSGTACQASVRDTLTFSLWKNLPPAPGKTWELVSGAEGNAIRCPKPGACKPATRASISFDSFEDGKKATGHWSASFADGTTEEGDFDAGFCTDTPRPCG